MVDLTSDKVGSLPLIYFIVIILGGLLVLATLFLLVHCTNKRMRLKKQLRTEERGEYARVQAKDSKLKHLSLTPSSVLQGHGDPDMESQTNSDRISRFSTFSSIATTGKSNGSSNKLRKLKSQYEPDRRSRSSTKPVAEPRYDDPDQFSALPCGSLTLKGIHSFNSRRSSATGSVLAPTPMSETDDPMSAANPGDTAIQPPPVIPRKSSRRNSSPGPIRALAAQHTRESSGHSQPPQIYLQIPYGPDVPDRRSSSQSQQTISYPVTTYSQGSGPENETKDPVRSPKPGTTADVFELDSNWTQGQPVRRSSSRYSTPGDTELWRSATPNLPRRSSRRTSDQSSTGQNAPHLPRKSSRRDSRRMSYGAQFDTRELFLE